MNTVAASAEEEKRSFSGRVIGRLKRSSVSVVS